MSKRVCRNANNKHLYSANVVTSEALKNLLRRFQIF